MQFYAVAYHKQISRSVFIRTGTAARVDSRSQRGRPARHNPTDDGAVMMMGPGASLLGALIITRAAATGVDAASNIVDAAPC